MSQLYEVCKIAYAGNALFSIANIASESVIASFDVYFTAQSILSDARLQELFRDCPDLCELLVGNEKLILTLFLAVCVANNPAESTTSLQYLPREIQNGVWTHAEDNDMAKTSLWPAIEAKRRVLERQWQALARNLCTFEQWQWADSIISSRCIGLARAPRPLKMMREYRGSTGEEVARALELPENPDLCLVPVLDYCNHAGTHRTARWEPSGSAIQLIATQSIATGEEITISYGDDKTNHELFYNYGFIVPENVNCQVNVSLPAPENAANDYWDKAREIYGISNKFVLNSHDMSMEKEGSSLEIMYAWNDLGTGIYLTESQLGALLLATSEKLLGSDIIVNLFSNGEQIAAPKIHQWAKAASAALASALQDALTRHDEKESGVRTGSIAQQLLSDERRGLSIFLQALSSCDVARKEAISNDTA